ncbi:MAG TPA: phage tail protein [Acidimicrobiales bacterium]|nr:phage tail protein [Acidimicrobiales bacterium]
MAAAFDQEHLGSQFALELEGIELARFTGCTGLAINTEVVEYQDTLANGNPVIRKRPGRTKYEDIVLKRGLSANKAITDWHQKVIDGAVERSNGSIVIYDSTGAEVDRWNFENGWPSKWSGGDLSADTDDVMIEELTISHELLTRA